MNDRLRRIGIGVCVGWTVVSLAAVAYGLVTRALASDGDEMAAPTASDNRPTRPLGEASPAIYHDLKPADPLMADLVYRYYPMRLSQYWEEMLIRDFFEDRRGGFFVDVGASHYKVRSTTHYLDKALGWHGIAIDAIAELAEGYAEHRPRTRFIPAFVGEKSDEDVDFVIFENNTRLSTADKEMASRYKGEKRITRKLKTVSLDDLLDAQKVTSIDFLKMDIELWEPAALRGFDIDRFKPKLVVLELHKKVRDELLAYMKKHGYVKLEQYMAWDGNGWFVPAEDLAAFKARKAADPIWAEHGAKAPPPEEAAAPSPRDP